MDRAREWLDERRDIVRDPTGEPWPLIDRVERWASRTESLVAELEQEARRRGPGAGRVDALAGDFSALTVDERRQLLALLEKADVVSVPDAEIVEGDQ